MGQHEEMVKEAHRLVATVEYRSMAPAEQAARITLNHNVTIRAAAEAVGSNTGSIARARQAIKEHRIVGHSGPPFIMHEDEKLQLLERIIDRYWKRDSPSITLILQEVRIVPSAGEPNLTYD